jgi:hypothetical protein
MQIPFSPKELAVSPFEMCSYFYFKNSDPLRENPIIIFRIRWAPEGQGTENEGVLERGAEEDI